MKNARRKKIADLVTQYDIDTQEELALRLNGEGFKVTQATVSRDIRDMKLMKIQMPDGRQKYALMDETQTDHGEKYARVLQDGFSKVDKAGHLLIVKTIPGMAMAVAAALDAMAWPEVAGTIAGDDTIMLAIRKESDVEELTERILDIVSEEGK